LVFGCEVALWAFATLPNPNASADALSQSEHNFKGFPSVR
jgi:hypothetical protein